MLKINPYERITLDEILAHKWITGILMHNEIPELEETQPESQDFTTIVKEDHSVAELVR